MITPEKEEYYLVPLGSYNGEKSLDHIATEFYGKPYKGFAAMERASNDTYQVYDLSTEDNCLDYTEDHYKPIDRWLALNIGDDVSFEWDNGPKIANYQSDIDEQAPDPGCALADMILKGHLPYGKYLVAVSW